MLNQEQFRLPTSSSTANVLLESTQVAGGGVWGDTGAGVFGIPVPQQTPDRFITMGQKAGSINPAALPEARVPQVTGGCPGRITEAVGLLTEFVFPQILQTGNPGLGGWEGLAWGG